MHPPKSPPMDLNAPITVPVAQPITGVGNELETPKKALTIRVIDWLRPDHALLRGMAMAKEPKPYEERYAHQGKREMERRKNQIRKGMLRDIGEPL